MQDIHHQVYKEGLDLIEQGFNVIPVRDKDEIKGGKTFPMKSPFSYWRKYMKERMTGGMLYSQLEKTNTTWIAMILGEISQRVVAIDIDNKHWLGVEHKLFSALKDMYAPLWKKLRIHQTQSGGFHILFQIPPEVEMLRSKKLAYKEGAKEAGIEMKGEGGFIVIPPSGGYSIYKKNKIPLLTGEEIAVIMAIIEDINEKKVIKKERVKTQKQDNDYYSESPFDSFNHSEDGASIIEKYGWKFEKESNHFIHFTRGGKNGGVSASFNKEKRYYHIFTTSDDTLEGNENYSPCFLVQHYEKWDGKELYAWLIANGYGKAYPMKEEDRARKLAQYKGEPLGNFSDKAKAVYDETVAGIKDKLPYGEFWKYGSKGELKLSRTRLYNVCTKLGFRIIHEELFRIENDIFLTAQSFRELQDALVDYVFCEDEEDYDDILDLLEKYFEKSTKYTIARLEIMGEDAILCDDRHHCYKAYQNGVLQIDSEGYKLIQYKDMDQFIYTKSVLKRNFIEEKKEGVYSKFLDKAVGFDDYTKKILGYMCHQWKDETTGYIITFTEKVPDPKQGGGSGKNVLTSLLTQLTSVCSTNGAQLQYDERFFQSWNKEKLMVLSDVPKNFDFGFIKEASTGSVKWRRLFKNPIDVPVDQAPKIVVLTNYSYEVTDGGIRRRIIPLEFSDYFTKKGGVDEEFGCHFPKGWKENDWAEFDQVMAEGVQLWIAGDCKLKSRELSDTGWLKQFQLTYGTVITEIINEYIDVWMNLGAVKASTLGENLQSFYANNDVNLRYRPSRKKINSGIEEWLSKQGLKFEKNVTRSYNGSSHKYYLFGDADPEEAIKKDLPF